MSSHRVSRNIYRQQPLDPSIPPVSSLASVLNLPSTRPGRRTRAEPLDLHPTKSYGDAIIQKASNNFRIFFKMSKVCLTPPHDMTTNTIYPVFRLMTLISPALRKPTRAGNTLTYLRISGHSYVASIARVKLFLAPHPQLVTASQCKNRFSLVEI